MMQLVLFLAIAAGLFSSLYFLARSDSRVEGGAQALVEARQALNSLQNGLLPAQLIGRIFARDDFEYVAAQGSKTVQELFCAERKRVALSWVGQVRTQIRSLRRFHNNSARFYARLSLGTELRLACDFQALLWACRALEVALRVSGPYAAPRMVQTAAASASRICIIYAKSMSFLTAPTGPGALPSDSSSEQAAL